MTIRKFYDFDGLGGGIDPKSSVKSDMTKEQIIQKHYPFYDENLTIKDVELNGEQCQALMKEYAQQQLSAELERSKKLVQCAESLLFLHGCEQEGLSSGKPSFADWIHATNNLQNEIDRFKSTDPETTGNQEVTNPST